MKTIILCGGQGTRIREASELIPKPMLEIGDNPILWHIMKTYSSFGHRDFVLATGHLSNYIKNYFLNYKYYTSDFTMHGNTPQIHEGGMDEDWTVTISDTGKNTMTGCRIHKCSKYIDDDFMVTYGDGVSNVNINDLVNFHKSHGKIATITGVRPSGRFGEIAVDQNGAINEFNEKPQSSSGHINGGYMVFKKEFLDKYLSGKEDEVLENEPMEGLVRDKEIMMFEHNDFWYPMDTPREHKILNDMWNSNKAPWKTW